MIGFFRTAKLEWKCDCQVLLNRSLSHMISAFKMSRAGQDENDLRYDYLLNITSLSRLYDLA